MHKLRIANFTMVKRIIRYLKSTSSFGLYLQGSPLTIHAFSDSDWVADPVDRRSVTGTFIFLCKNPILWTAKKQRSVAKSSTKAKYKALAYTSMDLAWVKMILHDLGITLRHPLVLYCDNISAIASMANPVFHSRTNHVAVDYHLFMNKPNGKSSPFASFPPIINLLLFLRSHCPAQDFVLWRTNWWS